MTQNPSYEELVLRVKDLEQRLGNHARVKKEVRFQSLFEFAPNPICLEEIESGRIRANRAMCRMLGYSQKALHTKTFEDITHPTEVETWSHNRKRLLRGDVPICQIEKRYISKSGNVIWGITALSLLRSTNGPPEYFTIQIQDITHIKRLEEQLLHAQKMKAVGTLAGGIAHDFNNLLMGIQGRVSLMLLNTHQGETPFEHLKKIEEHIRQAANLTNQLLGFARGGKYELAQTDLTELIKKETALFGRTRKQIALEQDFTPGLWPVKVDREQIRQVLLNVYINATQAMPDGGTLRIKTENVKLARFDNKPMEVPAGRFIKISITDTGVGMDQGIQQRIFEPFFTTQQMGRGTGLGLAFAYGIVRHHGGFFNVTSKKGQGTTFSVYLPAIEQETYMEEKTTKRIMAGQGTILLVDDEEMIIEIGQQMLAHLGYSVLTAESGQEAIKTYSESKETISLVILDMIMPQMNGEETFEGLQSADPDVKIVLSSGYNIDEKTTALLNRGAIGFIQKPFNMNQLSETIRDAMGSRSS